MRQTITVARKTVAYDAEAFPSVTYTTVLTTRAEREGRHGSEAWRNRAAFSEATDLFTIRKPGVDIDTSMVVVLNGDIYEITSIEDIRGRGMYLEILAKRVEPSGEGELQST